MQYDKITVGDAVRIARLRNNMSARQLSAAASLSPSYVTKLEAGELEPSLNAFARIARAVGMNQTEICFCVMYEAARSATVEE